MQEIVIMKQELQVITVYEPILLVCLPIILATFMCLLFHFPAQYNEQFPKECVLT